jgi:hypothetical protein
MFTHLDRVEWERVVRHVEAKHEGIIKVRRLEPTLQRFIVHEYFPRVEDYDTPGDSALLHPRDIKLTLCPFYQFDPSIGLFGCEIHEIKSRTCKAFYCAGSERFKSEMELCEHCWVFDMPLRNSRDTARDRDRPCDLGKGCPDLAYRVQFFIAYCRAHPEDPRIPSRTQYFMELLQKNKREFEQELIAMRVGEMTLQDSLAPIDMLLHVLTSI